MYDKILRYLGQYLDFSVTVETLDFPTFPIPHPSTIHKTSLELSQELAILPTSNNI